jgi:hypothetical protein
LYSSQPRCSAFRFREVTREKAKTPAQKTELRVVVPGSLAVTAVQGGLVSLLEPRAGVPENTEKYIQTTKNQSSWQRNKYTHYTYNNMVSTV